MNCSRYCCESCYRDGYKSVYGKVLCDNCKEIKVRNNRMKAAKAKEAKERKVEALREAAKQISMIGVIY